MKKLKIEIKDKLNNLINSDYSFQGLYKIIHDQDEHIFCEYMNGYEISKITYKECDDLCKRNANFLSNNISDKPGAFIGIMMENSIEWIISFWGLLMLGYKPMLLNDRLPKDINKYICNKLKIKTILSIEDCNLGLDVENNLLIKLNEIKKFNRVEFENWENEIGLSTTATSLNVKICVYNGRNFTNQVLNTKKILKENKMIKKHYKGSLKLLTFLPFYHIFGLVAVYFWFSIFGRTFVFLKDSSSNTILNTIKMHKVTHFFAVPMVWHIIYREISKQILASEEKTKRKFKKGIDFSIKIQSIAPNFGKSIAKVLFKEIQSKLFGDSIQFMISGGGQIKAEALKVINGIGYQLYNGYGMSEIGITSVELREKAKYRILGSIGQPFESVEYKIKDEKLFIKGSSLCSKIITDKEVIDIQQDEWFDTKDIAHMDNLGYYYIDGRYDEVFIGENGEKINPDLIEMNIEMTASKNYAVIGIEKDEKKFLALIVQISKEYTNIKTKKVLSEIKNNINNFTNLNLRIDKIYLTYDEIANANAIKVSRNLLLKNINDGKVNLIDLSEFKEIENKDVNDFQKDICETVKTIMSDILNIEKEKIKNDSHFIFELGGSSLDYLTLLMEIKDKFEIDLNFKNKSCSNALEFSEFISKELNVKNI